MILKLLKPSWRKLLITAGLYLMVGLSSGVDKTIREVSREHLATSALGQRYVAEIKRIYKESNCEESVKVKEVTARLMGNATYKDMEGSLALKVSILSWARIILLVVISYLMACVACTGAVIRLRENA